MPGLRRHRPASVTTQSQGPLVAGTAVILTGEWVDAALQAVLIAARSRDRNGLRNSDAHLALAKALAAAMSANGHLAVHKPEVAQHYPQLVPTVTIEAAAQQLNLSPRQIRRLAPKLGGKKIGGRWLLDEEAIDEHRKGLKWTQK